MNKYMFNIRKIQSADLSKCATLLEKSYGKPPYNEKFTDGDAFNYLKRKFDYCQDHSFIIEENNNIIGFILVNLSYWTGGDGAIIEEIVIDENKHGQGYGKKLMEFISDYSKKSGLTFLMLWGRKDAPSYNFYLKNGFIEDENIAVMFKKLNK